MGNNKIKDWIIDSPDNWLVKAGAFVDDSNKLHTPHFFLVTPMAMAATAIENFNNNKEDDLLKKTKNISVIANSVRSADTAYYKRVSKIFNKLNPNVHICGNCLRGQIWPNKMKILRKEVNSKIIHKMDNGEMIDSEDFHLAIGYYNEMFTHDLVNAKIEWKKFKLKSCDSCKKKNKRKM